LAIKLATFAGLTRTVVAVRPWAARTTFTRRPRRPTVTLRFREFQKLFATELAIFVSIEFVEQLIGIRRRGSPFTAASSAFPAFATLSGSTTLTATFTLATMSFAHCFPSCLPFFVAEFAIAVGIKFLNHPLAHFTIAAGTFKVLTFLSPRGAGRKQRKSQN
jgi:hypothetical protein